MNQQRWFGKAGSAFVASACLAAAAPVFGQAEQTTVFVSNNGNLRGGVTSFFIDSDGSLIHPQYLETGQRDSLSDPCPGCNAYSMAISPNGKYLVMGHPSSDIHPRHISIIRVHADASLELVGLWPVVGSPLDVAWLSNEHIAVTVPSGVNNGFRVHQFDEDANTLVQIDIEITNGFTGYFAVDHANQRLFTERTGQLYSYEIKPDGTVDLVDSMAMPTYTLGLGLSPDGSHLYAGAGISGGGNAIPGILIGETGMLHLMPDSPFTSPGASPKQVVVADNNPFAIAGHGTDATVRTFFIDQESGALAPTGHFFDVGLQGSLGNVGTMGDLVFFTDNTTAIDGIRGVYSFTLGPDGSLTQNGDVADTLGIAPRDVVTWTVATCAADLSGDGSVGVPDLLALLGEWGNCPGCDSDLDGDGSVGVPDLLALLADWGECK